jgi:type II secretory pathway pseudopilin PulG
MSGKLYHSNATPCAGCAAAPRRARMLSRRRGFTLMEAALATVIVGVGLLAMIQLMGSLTAQNAAAHQMTTARLLASHIQEAMAGLSFSDPAYANTYFGPEPGETLSSYNDVDDFDGRTFSPPIDSTRAAVPTLGQYSQEISVWPVHANQLNINTNPAAPDLPKSANTGAVRVLVKIYYQRVPSAPKFEVYRTAWIRTAG